MHIPDIAIICTVLLSFSLQSGIAQATYASGPENPVDTSAKPGQAAHVTASAASVGVNAPVVIPIGNQVPRKTVSPHISEDTPPQQTIAPQKSQTPEGSSVGSEGKSLNVRAAPRQR